MVSSVRCESHGGEFIMTDVNVNYIIVVNVLWNDSDKRFE